MASSQFNYHSKLVWLFLCLVTFLKLVIKILFSTEGEIEKKTTNLATLQDRQRSKKECLEQLNGQLQQTSSNLQRSVYIKK